MIDKKEFLLEQIIKAYIANLEPIGSSQLKSMYDISYSSATIRGYFKKLVDEGYLAQEHVSSGRTPTVEALRQHWKNRLRIKLNLIDIKRVDSLAKQIGITVFVKNETNDVLKNIIQIEEQYIILEFSTFPIIVKYSNALYRFLKDMINFEIVQILNIAKQVGAYEIYEKVNSFLQNRDFHIYNIKEFLALSLNYDFDEKSINLFLSGDILEKCSEGLYFEKLFPPQYIGICHNCIVEGRYSKLFVVGELSKNYEYFYNQIEII